MNDFDTYTIIKPKLSGQNDTRSVLLPVCKIYEMRCYIR